MEEGKGRITAPLLEVIGVKGVRFISKAGIARHAVRNQLGLRRVARGGGVGDVLLGMEKGGGVSCSWRPVSRGRTEMTGI